MLYSSIFQLLFKCIPRYRSGKMVEKGFGADGCQNHPCDKFSDRESLGIRDQQIGGLMHAFLTALRTRNRSLILSGPDETHESHLMVFASEESRHSGNEENWIDRTPRNRRFPAYGNDDLHKRGGFEVLKSICDHEKISWNNMFASGLCGFPVGMQPAKACNEQKEESMNVFSEITTWIRLTSGKGSNAFDSTEKEYMRLKIFDLPNKRVYDWI